MSSRGFATLAALALASGFASVSTAATIHGHLQNGTTNQPGTAESVRLIDMAGGMNQIALLQDVTGDFTFEDVPPTGGSPYIMQVQSGDVLYSQPVAMTGDSADVQFTVYDSTDALDAVSIDIYHVIFQRQHENMDVIELFEFQNTTNPPKAVWRDQGPIKVQLPPNVEGDVECSVNAGRMPLTEELLETDVDDVYTVPYALKPGTTRLVLRYTLPYTDEALDWKPTMFHPVQTRSILVSPDDIEVTAEGLDPAPADHAPPAGYEAFLGGPLAAEQTFAVHLQGGSQVAVDPHAGMNDSGGQADGTIDIRPNRLLQARGFVLLGLMALLMITFVVALDRSAPARAVSEAEQKLARLEDGYVTGTIDRHTFEQQRRRLLGLADEKQSRPSKEPVASRKA